MSCPYIRELKKCFSPELIKAFHIITGGEIYCPIHQENHEFTEEDEHETETNEQEILVIDRIRDTRSA